jgi:hypothetical protein
MQSNNGFIPDSLLIPVIIRKSRFAFYHLHAALTHLHRVLMLAIRHLGDCPCPRCKIPMERLHLIGTESDRNDQVALRRHDNDSFKEAISSRQRKIYKENYKVTSAWIERKLKSESLVPTKVNVSLLEVMANVK